MALQSIVGEVVLSPLMSVMQAPLISDLGALLDSSGDEVGYVFRVPKAGNITKVGWRTGFATNVTGANAVRVGLYTVDPANGNPTANLYGGSNYVDRVPSGSYVWYWETLGTQASATEGDYVALKFSWKSFVTGNYCYFSGYHSNAEPFPDNNRSYIKYMDASTWYADTYRLVPCMAIEYSDGSIEYIAGTCPYSAVNAHSFNSGSGPNHIGLRFKFPFKARLKGVIMSCILNGDFDLKLYDSDGVTVLTSISVDKDIKQGATAFVTYILFNTAQVLLANTFYRVVVVPTTATSLTIYSGDVTDEGANKAMNAVNGGENFHHTTANAAPTQESDWTQTATRRPLIGLILDQLDDGASGGGSSNGGFIR